MFPPPPEHLGDEAAAWWTAVVREYALDDTQLLLLTTACETLDRLRAAQQMIAVEGMVVASSRGGSRVHPAVQIERDARVHLLRVVRELRLEPDSGPSLGGLR